MRNQLRYWAIGAVLLSAACSFSGTDPKTAGAGGRGSYSPPDAGNTAAGGADGGTGIAPTFDANCGNATSAMTRLPADLLVVVDRSGSMVNSIAEETACDPPSAACPQRWATLVAGMTKVLAASPATIDWGLKFFSSPGITGAQGGVPEGCVVSPGVDVAVGKGNTAAILGAIAASSPGYNTPTRAAITTSTAYLTALSDGRPKYILLATDGQPNCAAAGAYATEPDMDATLDAISAALTAGIKVYVIGVGPSAGNLDEMAQRGGTGNFYPALSPDALNAALASIAGIVASCVYEMGATPPDPDNLGVYLDKQLVKRDSTDGWILSGPSTVTFTGATCDRIKTGTYKDVQVLFGCPGVPSPPVIP